VEQQSEKRSMQYIAVEQWITMEHQSNEACKNGALEQWSDTTMVQLSQGAAVQ
jgi:hypothetical protein